MINLDRNTTYPGLTILVWVSNRVRLCHPEQKHIFYGVRLAVPNVKNRLCYL